MIIPVIGILMPTVLVPTIITLKQRQQKRQWRHQERLRAIEMGLPVPPVDPGIGGGSVVAIGAGVPLAAMFAALVLSANIPHSSDEYVPILGVVWGCTVVISTAALITSLVLGVIVSRSRKPLESDQFAAFKPAYEPDAYDVVSRRG
jgi:hypothetical protein